MALTDYAVQVRSNSLILFPIPKGMVYTKFDLTRNPTPTYSGMMTPHTRKRIASSLDILIQRTPKRNIYNPISDKNFDFHLNFITLTMPNDKAITARRGYDVLLSKYLRYLKDKAGLNNYVWKVELQQNRQPHWHLVTDTFIEWPVIRWKWNNLLKQERLLDKYALKHGHFNAPSTEIHAVESIHDMQRYLAKELCKSNYVTIANGEPAVNVRWNKEQKLYDGYLYEDYQTGEMTGIQWGEDLQCIDFPEPQYKLVESRIDGKMWDCTEKLKIGRFSTVMDTDTNKKIYAEKQRGLLDIERTEHCEIVKTLNPLRLLSSEILRDYKIYIN